MADDRCVLCVVDNVPFIKKARRGWNTCSDCNRREKMRKYQEYIAPIKHANAALRTTVSVIAKAGEDALEAKERAKNLNEKAVTGKQAFESIIDDADEFIKKNLELEAEEQQDLLNRRARNRQNPNGNNPNQQNPQDPNGGNAPANNQGQQPNPNQQNPQGQQQNQQNQDQQQNPQGGDNTGNNPVLGQILQKLLLLETIQQDIRDVKHDISTHSARITAVNDKIESKIEADAKRRRDAAEKAAETKRKKKSTVIIDNPRSQEKKDEWSRYIEDDDDDIDVGTESIKVSNIRSSLPTGNSPPQPSLSNPFSQINSNNQDIHDPANNMINI